MVKTFLAKLGPLLLTSIIWFSIGWLIRGWFGPTPGIPAEAQRILRAGQIILTQHYPPFDGPAPTASQLAAQAVRGLLTATDDPYAALIGPPASQRFQDDFSGKTGAPGLWFEIHDGKFIIVALRDEGSAMRAGLHVGDELLAVEGVPLTSLTSGEEVALLLRGPIGTEAKLTVQQGGTQRNVTLRREEREQLTTKLLTNQIGYLKLPGFHADGDAAVKAAFHALLSQGVQALVWDLRGNRGGSMLATQTILNDFIPSGILYSVEFKDGKQQRFTADGSATIVKEPLVILVDQQTYSSSEMAAAALRDNQRGVVIGANTGGKGVIQDTVPLDVDYLIHLSIAKWFTPKGEWLHERGLTPDVAVVDDPATEVDEAIAAAMTYLEPKVDHP